MGEKNFDDSKPLGALSPQKRRSVAAAVLVAPMLFAMYYTWPDLAALIPGPPLSREYAVSKEFSWTKISPSESFEWHSCFDGLQCARLSVPMDWNNASLPDRVAIAVVKVSAKVPATDSRYGGPILMNPGGPGSSGVFQVRSGGRHIQTIADPHLDPSEGANGKYFDVIGFDPRTVGSTTPHLTCFPDSVAENNFRHSGASLFDMADSEAALSREWARKDALGVSCAAPREGRAANIAHYANTPQVVQDMVAIIERHGEWREKEAGCVYREGKKEKLNYWGFSYGTILGQTFAAMHPDRVHRLVVDGVADAADYYATNWLKNLQDTDRIGSRWSDYCLQSGSADKCPLYSPNMPHDYMRMIIGIISQRLYNTPVALPNVDNGPLTFEHDDVMLLLMATLYYPFRLSHSFFDLLGTRNSSINVTRASAYKAKRARPQPLLPPACLKAGPFSEECVSSQSSSLSSVAISCSDGDDVTGVTRDEWKEYLEVLQRQSDMLGTHWSGNRFACTGWKARPAWTFKEAIAADTASPLLLIGNTLDPVTPLRNAHRASTLFPGSVVVEQNTEGHCSYSSPSIGTAKIIRAYFQTGALPGPGIVTVPEWLPFVGFLNSTQRDEVDAKIWGAQVSLARMWPEDGLDF